MATERTFIMIKPDGVQKNLVGEIISRFTKKGLALKGLKQIIRVSDEVAKAHYGDLSEKPFFGELIEYIQSGPVIAMVFEGQNAVVAGRQLIGATNPLAATPGGDFALTVAANIVHGSDSVENGQKEIALWFAAEEVIQ